MRTVTAAALTAVLLAAPEARAIDLELLGTHRTGIFDEGAQEVVAWDPAHHRLYAVNAAAAVVEVLDLSDPADPHKIAELDAGLDTGDGAGANSVAVKAGLVAVAVERDPVQLPGYVAFYDAATLAYLGKAPVGALPDMVVFTSDGSKVLVANEGEPSGDYGVDPEGSVSIVDVSNGASNATVRTAGFAAFNKHRDELVAAGVRIYGPGATVAQDLEPEYIAVADHEPLAWVVLQENNAIAEINLASARVMRILPLGVKDHSLPGYELDASNSDDAIRIESWPVFGLYQPDATVFFRDGGKRWLAMVNEGDVREYDAFEEAARVRDLDLDPGTFPDAATLQANANLGRLNVTTTLGDTDGDGDFDALYAFGARSLTIRDAASGKPVWDSGNEIESVTANLDPAHFNSNNDDNDSFDARSDDKGPEPEALAIGELDGRRYAFVGLERVGGVVIYDITDPTAPEFRMWVNNRDWTKDAEDPDAGDLGPESIVFIPAAESPDSRPLLVVANEVSGSTSVYRITD